MAKKRGAIPSTDLGLRIKSVRNERRKTQEQLATAVGVTKGAVSQWENGDVHNLRLTHFFKLADYLRVNPRWLAIGRGPRESDPGDAIPPEVLKIARRIAAMTPERLALLYDMLGVSGQ